MRTFQLRAVPVKLAIVAAILLATAATFAASAESHSSHHQDSGASLHDPMRQLWEDHIVWTRMYIVSAVAELPDQELAAERLLRNQADIGDAIAVYYGQEAGAQLTALLREHILGAADLLAAAKLGDDAAIETAAAAWYANGDEIAAFLHGANPDHWPLEELEAQMTMHLDLTLAEATARLQGDFSADIAAYDEIHTHILMMADILSSGIAAQFPEQFAS